MGPDIYLAVVASLAGRGGSRGERPGQDPLVGLDVAEGELVGVLLGAPVDAPEVAEVVVELVEDGEGVEEVLPARGEDLPPVPRVDGEDPPAVPLGRPDGEFGALNFVVLAEEV